MEHEKIKICYIIPDLGFGGAQRQLLLLLEHLDRKLFSHSVINLNASPDIAEFHDVGTRVIRMHYTGQRDLKKIFSLARILSVEKPHITHTMLTSANFYGLIAAALSGAPYKILSERSLGNNFTGLRKFTYPQVYRLADVIVTNSTASSQHIAKISNGSCHKNSIIPNGFNRPSRSNSANLHSTKINYGIKSDDFVVGTVTHLTPEKDVMCGQYLGRLSRRHGRRRHGAHARRFGPARGRRQGGFGGRSNSKEILDPTLLVSNISNPLE